MKRTAMFQGKPVEDATEPLTVRVTKDVRGAKQRAPMTCAIAKGCTHNEAVISARIGQKVALIEFKNKFVRYEIDPGDTQKIRAFDYAKYFEPGKIVLKKPVRKVLGVHTTGHRKKKSKNASGPSGKHIHTRQPIRHMIRVK